MHLPELISDLAIMLLTAGVVTVIFKKIKQPLVLGYIVAGFLIGPYMPLFFTVADSASISTWSEIGVIVLMFGLGLEFNLHKLAQVGGTAIITALTEVGGMLLIGFGVGQLLGWGIMDSVFLGGMLSMSSTTIIIKAFDELGVRNQGFAQLVFGTLVIEDIAGIFMMIILSTLSVSQSISGGALAMKLALLVLYLALWLILGIYLLPTLMNKATPLMNDETLLVSSLGICFGMVLLANALGFSSALGAFMAGSLLAGTVHAERVEHLTSGVKDLFGSVFFLSVGMMLDPAMIVKYIVPILIITLVTLVGKLIFSSLGVLLSGQTLKNAVHCGCSLAQIGEFAFIIASLGLSLGVIADYIYPIIVSVSIITTLTTPSFIKGSDKLYEWLEKVLPSKLTEKLARYTDEEQSSKEKNGDWSAYLGRYVKVTAFYGVVMLGIALIGSLVQLPLLGKLGLEPWLAKLICLAVVYLGMSIFIRPMLDMKSPQFTTLWVKNRNFRLPLMALTAIRVLIIVIIAFIPANTVSGVAGLWLLPLILAAVLLIYRSGWFASAYLSVEARFLANFNERQLQRLDSDDAVEWLDQRLHVLSFQYEQQGGTLKELGWGKRFGVNVIKIVRGKRHINIPSGDAALHSGDTVYILGEPAELRNLCLDLGIAEPAELPTLREFIAAEDSDPDALYSYAISVDKGSELAGKTVRGSGIRDNYDCMVLGLQRSRLPIAQPDVNMQIQNGDLVWVLGAKVMAGKLLANVVEEN
ncbi:MAG: cation:proton antiporter [Candidatus Limivicinus sp.]|nr:cation:proton antiporter [Candidatus Limivicinus sp.]